MRVILEIGAKRKITIMHCRSLSNYRVVLEETSYKVILIEKIKKGFKNLNFVNEFRYATLQVRLNDEVRDIVLKVLNVVTAKFKHNL